MPTVAGAAIVDNAVPDDVFGGKGPKLGESYFPSSESIALFVIISSSGRDWGAEAGMRVRMRVW